ncbi:hypothetical protein PAXRUDRAFT_162948 [Paxillus rubicundulus Ve08.2h10]|uniref:Uncharacterized protein n=1 Tax=Paxillus rubicundulus Ve08.2h10 TaxID=930991 RepID=A0A0D0D5C5_9AGAM|nr:hypothetical protein PAXRUDRAFT_162948 [Paxillus rubicundulus Ve08.2h10]
MHPNTSKADLPSTHNISTYVHNSFIEFLNNLKVRIQVTTAGCISTTTNLWSVDQTKAAFMGLTAHWIEKNIKSGAWTMCSEVMSPCSHIFRERRLAWPDNFTMHTEGLSWARRMSIQCWSKYGWAQQ